MALILYGHSTSVCVLKVRLTLVEKGVPFEERFVDLRRGAQFESGYLALNPAGVVPTVVHDGQVLRESSVIQYTLEDRFPSPSLMPGDPSARYRVRWLMRMIDDPLHAACGVLTQGISFRKDYRTPEEIEARMAKIPDPRRRARQRSVFAEGLDSPFVADAVGDYDSFLRAMDEMLAGEPYLGGSGYSLADAAATPYVNRLKTIGIADAWRNDCPNVWAWFDRIRQRSSFAQAVTSHLTADDADRMRPVDSDAAHRIAAILAS